MQVNPANDNPKLERCLDLFTAHQRRLFLFISALIPSPADVEEVLQETNIVIWKKFDQFDPDAPESDFLAWAFKIARYQVLDYQRRSSKRHATFSPDVIAQLTTQAVEHDVLLERRRAALAACVKKLADDDHKLIRLCYAEAAQVPQISVELQRTATSVYRTLRRIRRQLAMCIDSTLEREDTR